MLANEEYEHLYSPTRWSKRFSSDEVVEKHIQFFNKHSRTVQSQIPCELNISYGLEQRDVYDLFGIDLNDESPILIHIHGGYYQEESVTHTNNSFISNVFYECGIKTIILGYELSPNRTVPEILEHIKIGLRTCIQYARKINSRGVYLSGHSAGAHAIATILTDLRKTLEKEEQDLIKGAFLISGLYNMVPITKMSANQILDLTEEVARDISPYFDKPDYGNTKIYIIAAENDTPAFIKQAKQFYTKLKEEMKTELHIVSNADHFDIVENLYCADFSLTKIMVNAINKVS